MTQESSGLAIGSIIFIISGLIVINIGSFLKMVKVKKEFTKRTLQVGKVWQVVGWSAVLIGILGFIIALIPK